MLMMAKNIWYISKYFTPDLNGTIGTRSWLLLMHFYNSGNNVRAFTSDSNHLAGGSIPLISSNVQLQTISGISVVWLRTYKYSIAKSLSRILSWLHFEFNLFFLNFTKFEIPDAIIISSPSLITILNGIRLKYKYKCKLIVEVRDIWPLTLTEDGKFSRWNPFIITLAAIEWLGYKNADLIVGTMPNLSEHVKKISGDCLKVCCIPMVISDEMASPTESISRDFIDQYFPDDFFNVLYTGTIGISNSLETFFEAAALLIDYDRIRFVLVGDGALKEDYRLKYSHLTNVIFAPSVKKNQVASVLRCSDLVYFSTSKSMIWNYGLSLNKVVDYMLSGKPIVASFSGFESMINEAKCGFFVPAEDPHALSSKVLDLFRMPSEELASIGLLGHDWIVSNRNYKIIGDLYLNHIFCSDYS
jgi:glycosyltransferase involved in cell wall biosynthesis